MPAPRADWEELYRAGLADLDRGALDDALDAFERSAAAGATSWEPYYARAWVLLREVADLDERARAAAEAAEAAAAEAAAAALAAEQQPDLFDPFDPLEPFDLPAEPEPRPEPDPEPTPAAAPEPAAPVIDVTDDVVDVRDRPPGEPEPPAAPTPPGDGEPDPALHRERLLADAESCLATAVDGLGAGADAHALRGRVAQLRFDYDAAVRHYLAAVSRTSRPDAVNQGLTDSLTELLCQLEESADETAQGTCDDLLKVIDTVALAPNLATALQAEVLVTRACCRRTQGDVAGAEEDLREARKLVPGHTRIPRNLDAPEDAAGPDGPASGSTEPDFGAVGGLDEPSTFMHQVRTIFETYFNEPDLARLRAQLAEYGQTPTRAVLLFGPSGSGKTYLVRALSGEYRRRHGYELPIVRLPLNEVLGRYVGDAERMLTGILRKATVSQPSILFADEVDALGLSRDDAQDWRVQMTGHLLQELDRLREQRTAVLIIGCTNRLWDVDLALVRRFDRIIPVALPNRAVRQDILRVHLGNLGERLRPEHVDLDDLARRTRGMPPADIEKAIARCTDELLAERSRGLPERRLRQSDLVEAIAQHQDPMPLREWVRQSLAALRRLGHNGMAEDLLRLYGPYVDESVHAEGEQQSGRPTARIPADAWAEPPEYDLTILNRQRR